MKIYTKTGDAGTTSLVGGTRISKADLRLEAYGTADELNSFVGLLRAECTDSRYAAVDALLHSVQNKLFNLGSWLATEPDKMHYLDGMLLTTADVEALEQAIDLMQADLPVLRSFILPAGNRRIALAHVCRTLTRRLERRMVQLRLALPPASSAAEADAAEADTALSPAAEAASQYVNRLSDYFFILAKKLAQIDGCDVFLWEK